MNTDNYLTIPYSLIKRSYINPDGANIEEKQKDFKRCPNISALLDEYITWFNSDANINKGQLLVSFNDSLDNRLRNKNARDVIKYEMQKHLQPAWFDGSLTFSHTYQLHKNQFDKCINKIGGLPKMKVYSQTSDNWAIKKFMEDIITNRRKSVNKMNRKVQSSDKNFTRKITISDPEGLPSQLTNSSPQIVSSPHHSFAQSHSQMRSIDVTDLNSLSTNQLSLCNNKSESHDATDKITKFNCNAVDLESFKQKCYNVEKRNLHFQQKRMIVDNLDDDMIWKKVAKSSEIKLSYALPENHLKAVRQSLIEAFICCDDTSESNDVLLKTTCNQSQDNLWLKFKELERSIYSVCNSKNLNKTAAASKSVKRGRGEFSENEELPSLNAPAVRKSGRTAIPSQKVKERNNTSKP